MSNSLNIAMAQLNLLVGDIDGNVEKIIAAAQQARDEFSADIIMFPELAVTSYPPEDLLLRPSLITRVERALAQIGRRVDGITVLVGCPISHENQLFNGAVVIQDGAVIGHYFKHHLPNYQVFDEVRYFTPGNQQSCVFQVNGISLGVTICEDIWFPGPVAGAKDAGAELILNINASPFHMHKQQQRQQVLQQRVAESGLPICYLNLVGGQDELVFDGASMLVDAKGIGFTAPAYKEGIYNLRFEKTSQGVQTVAQALPASAEALSTEAQVYEALKMGLRDYIDKNGFKGIVLGLSGGIDSGLSLAIAADALGPERVEAVMMPFRYTSAMSLEDAELEAENFGVAYQVLPIEPIYEAFMATLEQPFRGTKADKTEENLQARCRGTLLMAISNKKGAIVLTTGNKSEMAVGYATLYGDMVGGYNVLKDVPKSLVFKLAQYRNQVAGYPIIPQRMIDRPPSAELAPGQVDEDSLPPYSELDQILEWYIEQDLSAEAIVAKGFAKDDVYQVVRLVDINEYKRSQAPIGVRVTSRGFGKDRRYPLTFKWPAGD